MAYIMQQYTKRRVTNDRIASNFKFTKDTQILHSQVMNYTEAVMSRPLACFNIKMLCYLYGNSFYEDNMVLSLYLHLERLSLY